MGDRSPKRRRIEDDRLSVRPRPNHARPPHWSRRNSPASSRAETPRYSGASTPRQKPFDNEVEQQFEDPEDDAALDREWYMGAEDGAAVEEYNPFGGADSTWLDREREVALANKKSNSRFNAKAVQKQKDIDSWEKNRMLSSGIAQQRGGFDGDEDDEGTRVHVLVHELKPPFLQNQTVWSKQLEPVNPVRDPLGDMAILARKGSNVVRERRAQREREKQTRDAVQVSGTLANVMGVKEEDTDSAAPIPGEETRSSNKFSDHFKQSKGQSNFSRSKTLREQRQSLPAFAVREELLDVIRDNQVVIVIGETGSGKTTQMAQFLYEDGYRGIAVTQPRRVAAMSVAKRVSEEMEVRLGGVVGYAIRFEDCTSKETSIKFCTEGVLLRETLQDSYLDKYSVVILDEAHERSLNTDILMGLMKNVLAKRRDIKLIVTSATMAAERFQRFYQGSPSYTIPGRTYPVDKNFSRTNCTDFVDAAVTQVLKIAVSEGQGDVLVFMPGQEEIEVTCELIEDRRKLLNDPPKLLILPIYSQMPADLQAKIFDPAPQGMRKIVVATNIAETSLTVDGIAFVVDSGMSKLKVYNPKLACDTLQITPISQANAMQRAGRGGRTGPGKCFFLYTERSYRDELYPQTIPEIQRTSLANTVLLLKSLGIKNLLDFEMLDSPPQEAVVKSLYDLWALGAIDNLGELTSLGKRMVSFPMDPPLAKLILTACEQGCGEEALTIVSMLSVPTVFYRPKERQEESDAAREKFFVPESDHLTLLHVYSQWKVNGFSERWATRHFLHHKALARAREVRQQLQDIVKTQELKLESCGTDWDVIRKCICSAYYHQAAKVKGIGEYICLRTSLTCALHPTSALYGLGFLPDYVIYHELILTSKEYLSCVTSVDPHWLADEGGVFYSIKEKGFSARDKRVTEVEFNKKAELEAKMADDLAREAQRLADEEENAISAVVKRPSTMKKTASLGEVKRGVIGKKKGRGGLSFN